MIDNRPNPHVKWDDWDGLDEFVAEDVSMVHFEAVDRCRWYANIYLADGQVWTLKFGSSTGRAKGYAAADRIE